MGIHNLPAQLEQADFPASGILAENAAGILIAFGTTVPSDAATGYAPGCLFIHTDGSGASDVLYKNVGTAASANFDTVETGA